MDDLGPPIAFLVLEEGTPVYDPGGERVGVVEHVLMEADIFEGLIIHKHPLPGGHLFADADQIAELHERGVVLSVGRDELHEPNEKHGEESETVEGPLERRLRRAWDWITRRD